MCQCWEEKNTDKQLIPMNPEPLNQTELTQLKDLLLNPQSYKVNIDTLRRFWVNFEMAKEDSQVLDNYHNNPDWLKHRVKGRDYSFPEFVDNTILEHNNLKTLCEQMLASLLFLTERKHDGDCQYTDKSDEGCYLCTREENKRWPDILKTVVAAHKLGIGTK